MQVGDLASWSARMFAGFTAEGETLEVFDSLGDEILDVRSSDPVDNTVPSGRSAAAEVALLLAEIGVEGSAETGSTGSVAVGDSSIGPAGVDSLSTGGLIELRDRLLGVYRALAGRAPRGCGHALWQSERALSPIRVATRDASLNGMAIRHPAVTLVTDATGVPGDSGAEVEVPEGAAIVCQGTQCSLPVTTVEDLKALLDG